MNTKRFRLLKTMALLHELGQASMTIGEISRWANMPKSTARRNLGDLVEMKLINCTSADIPTGYAWMLSLSKLGNEVFMSQKEVF